MSSTPRASVLAPFHVRSFRFQWPADLATSWAFEMETLILGWYVLVETRSVFMLTVFASLLYVGTLLAPMFGVMGDRIGHRNLLCAMRAVYAACAIALMVFSFMGVITPVLVLAITAIVGLVRPSDIGMRAALVGETMPGERLVGAMSIQRTTQDSARIAGALTGAGLFATLGMGPAYAVVAAFYVTSILLTWRAGDARAGIVPATDAPARPRDTSAESQVSAAGTMTRSPQTAGSAGNESARPRDTSAESQVSAAGTMTRSPQTAGSAGNESARPSPWRDLKEGLAYVWNTPHLRAAMLLAFLLNLTAFPLFTGLLPVVAKEVYLSDQTTLGYMVSGAAFGALLGSVVLSRFGHAVRPARMMIVFSLAWFAMLLVFAHMSHPAAGIPALMLAGLAQSLGLVPATAMLLRASDQFRGRIMGIRMLAIYGNLPGLLISGPLIAGFGYPVTASLYCAIGIVFTLIIAVRWREQLWHLDSPANKR